MLTKVVPEKNLTQKIKVKNLAYTEEGRVPLKHHQQAETRYFIGRK